MAAGQEHCCLPVPGEQGPHRTPVLWPHSDVHRTSPNQHLWRFNLPASREREQKGMYSPSASCQVLQRSWWAGVTGFTMIYYLLTWSSPHELLCLLHWRRSPRVIDCCDWQGQPSYKRQVCCMTPPNSGSDLNAQYTIKSCPKHKPNFRQNPQFFLTNTWHWVWWRLSSTLQMWALGIWICMWCNVLRF